MKMAMVGTVGCGKTRLIRAVNEWPHVPGVYSECERYLNGGQLHIREVNNANPRNQTLRATPALFTKDGQPNPGVNDRLDNRMTELEIRRAANDGVAVGQDQTLQLTVWDLAGEDVSTILTQAIDDSRTPAYEAFEKIFKDVDIILFIIDIYGPFKKNINAQGIDTEARINNFISEIHNQVDNAAKISSLQKEGKLSKLSKFGIILSKIDGIRNQRFRKFIEECRQYHQYRTLFKNRGVDILNYFAQRQRNQPPISTNFRRQRLIEIWPFNFVFAELGGIRRELFVTSAHGLGAKGNDIDVRRWIPYAVIDPLIWAIDNDCNEAGMEA